MSSHTKPKRPPAVGLLFLCAGLLATVTGCGSPLAKVTGQITLDGEPIAAGEDVRATVYFYPQGGVGAPAVGLLDEQGRYEIATGSKSGIMPGAYVVAVSATKIIPAKQPGEAPTGRPFTSRKYADPQQSGLNAEVQSGSNTFDFSLESDRTVRRRR